MEQSKARFSLIPAFTRIDIERLAEMARQVGVLSGKVQVIEEEGAGPQNVTLRLLASDRELLRRLAAAYPQLSTSAIVRLGLRVLAQVTLGYSLPLETVFAERPRRGRKAKTEGRQTTAGG